MNGPSAGVRRGDVITSVGGEAITSIDGLHSLVTTNHKVGDEITLLVGFEGFKD